MPESNDKDEISVLTSWMKRQGFWYPLDPTDPNKDPCVIHRYGFNGIEVCVLYLSSTFKHISVTMLNDEGVRPMFIYDRSIFDALNLIEILEQGILGILPEEESYE